MSMQSDSSLHSLLGDANAEAFRALERNEKAIREHAGVDPVAFVGSGTASDGRNVDRNAIIYLTANVLGIAVDGEVVDGFPRKHISDFRPVAASSGGVFPVEVVAAPVNSRYELHFDDAAMQRRFIDALSQ